MNDHVRPCNSKPQQRDLTPVLHRPVELATHSGRGVCIAAVEIAFIIAGMRSNLSLLRPSGLRGLGWVGCAAAYAAPVIPKGPARLLSPTFKSSSGEYRD